MAGQPGGSSKRSELLVNIIIALIGVAGGVISSQITAQVTHSADEQAYNEKFAEVLEDAIPNLSNHDRSDMAYAGLLTLAANDEQRKQLALLAQDTHSNGPAEILAVFEQVSPDWKATKERNLEFFQELSKIKAAIDIQERSVESTPVPLPSTATPQQRQESRTATLAESAAIPTAGSLALLQANTVPTQGWLYYGRIGSPGTGECVEPSSGIPTPNTTWTLCGPRYVRDNPPGAGSLKHIIGALPPGTSVRIIATDPIYLTPNAKAVWIKADITKSSLISE